MILDVMENKKMFKLSHDIIVCVHNSVDDTIECLESLVKNRASGVDGEILIVNDCSNDLTMSRINKFCEKKINIRVINLSSQHYYTKAANVGLRNSSASIKTLINSDTVVTKGWEEKVLSAFAANPALGILGPLSNAASTQSVPFVDGTKNQTAVNTLPPDITVEEFSSEISNIAKIFKYPVVPLVHGFCFSISSNVIDEIGYLDEENFPRGYGEENDYCFRADDAGFILKVAIDSFVFHKKSKSYKDSERVVFMQDGMQSLVRKFSASRIEYSVAYMKNNPTLQAIRESVLKKWSNYYLC